MPEIRLDVRLRPAGPPLAAPWDMRRAHQVICAEIRAALLALAPDRAHAAALDRPPLPWSDDPQARRIRIRFDDDGGAETCGMIARGWWYELALLAWRDRLNRALRPGGWRTADPVPPLAEALSAPRDEVLVEAAGALWIASRYALEGPDPALYGDGQRLPLDALDPIARAAVVEAAESGTCQDGLTERLRALCAPPASTPRAGLEQERALLNASTPAGVEARCAWLARTEGPRSSALRRGLLAACGHPSPAARAAGLQGLARSFRQNERIPESIADALIAGLGDPEAGPLRAAAESVRRLARGRPALRRRAFEAIGARLQDPSAPLDLLIEQLAFTLPAPPPDLDPAPLAPPLSRAAAEATDPRAALAASIAAARLGLPDPAGGST